MTFAQRRNRLRTHFSECIPVVKRHMIVIHLKLLRSYDCPSYNIQTKAQRPGNYELYLSVCETTQKSLQFWSTTKICNRSRGGDQKFLTFPINYTFLYISSRGEQKGRVSEMLCSSGILYHRRSAYMSLVLRESQNNDKFR